MEAGKFYSAKSGPQEWKEGSIDAKVTDVKTCYPWNPYHYEKKSFIFAKNFKRRFE
jgi:hypothetical protein